MDGKWISTKDKLPKHGKYVIAKHNKGTWMDSSDQENVNTVVVKFVRGISVEEREKMEKGELPQTLEKGWCLSDGWRETERSGVYKSEDEGRNNQLPYNWQMFGQNSFYGQEITHWTEIPPIINYNGKPTNNS
jgi:hypothetical protein